MFDNTAKKGKDNLEVMKMPRATHKGALSFGMVHVPVELYTATQDNDIHFNQLCKDDGSRVKYKKVCSKCGKEVGNDDIVKGFEIEEGKYVTLTDEDFEKAKSEKDKNITILHFTDLHSVRPIYFDKTYHIVPTSGGEKAFTLMRQAMSEENKIAIAKTVMGNSEKLLAIIPTDEGMLAVTLFFVDEVKVIPKNIPKLEVTKEEVTVAKTLIKAMEKEFEPDLYHDEYQKKLLEIIQMKKDGKEIVASDNDTTIVVINIMEAMQQTLKEMQKTGKKSTKKAAGKK